MPTERVRVAAYARCVDEAGRLLLCHLAPHLGHGDLWTLPGGGLDFGESPAAAVIRELAEETGYAGAVDGLLDVSDGLFAGDGGLEQVHAIRIVYAVRVTGGALRDEPDGSTDTCRWLTLDATGDLRLTELARREVERLRAAG